MEASEDGDVELIEFEMESRIAKFLIQNFEDQKDAHHEIKGCFFARSSIYYFKGEGGGAITRASDDIGKGVNPGAEREHTKERDKKDGGGAAEITESGSGKNIGSSGRQQKRSEAGRKEQKDKKKKRDRAKRRKQAAERTRKKQQEAREAATSTADGDTSTTARNLIQDIMDADPDTTSSSSSNAPTNASQERAGEQTSEGTRP